MANIEKEYGVADKMVTGLAPRVESMSLKASTTVQALQASETSFAANRELAELTLLRKMQGLHAPLRLAAEKRAVSSIGHLPCISTRSNLLADVLSGSDDTITFDDIYGKREDFEGLIRPHDIIEKKIFGSN